MTTDPEPDTLFESQRTVSRDELKMKQCKDDHDDLEAVAEVGSDVEELLE